MKKRTTSNNIGLIVILVKIGPKMLSILSKLAGVIFKALKGFVGLKTLGAAASLGVYSLLFTWQMALSLVAFILIHEYGHLWAMKRCGIKTKGIYLIPGFGGAAVAEESFKSGRNEAFISIMGPLFGLLFIIPMIALYFWTTDPIFAAIASIMSLINLFNLFPINPLDGGRIAKSLLYSIRDSVGFLMMLASFAAAIVLAFVTGFSLLYFIAIIGLWEILADYGLLGSLRYFRTTLIRGVLCF